MPKLDCNQENMLKWVEALESGDWQQGREYLERETAYGLQHCCLGVACRVAIDDGVGIVVKAEDSATRFADVPEAFGSVAFPPLAVMEWLGVKVNEDTEPDPIIEYEHAGGVEVSLTATAANDGKEYTFAEIARALRETYLSDS